MSIPLHKTGLAVITGALVLTLAACGGGSGSATSSPTTTQAARPSRANVPPGTFGTAAAVSGSNIEVQNRQSGQVTVTFNSATKWTATTPATLADVKVGGCVSVTAASGGTQAKALTATAVEITAATSKGCTVGGAFGGVGGGGGFGNGRGGSRTPNPSRQPRPSGTQNPANFGRAFGSVTAVSATGFTVKGVARGSNPAVTTVVTVNSGTTYTKTASATAAALVVGDCVAAVGSSDDTGAVTAKTIAVSKPGKNGCSFGFGGGGRGFRGGTGGGNG
ncbi:MAG TPA: hypothetical protein VHF06_36410 [Pseudonocardiaceae bacterium]|jgi:hypothetical protein|nr:hypothetical protein [Pseudonocardiaceae bacterium]